MAKGKRKRSGRKKRRNEGIVLRTEEDFKRAFEHFPDDLSCEMILAYRRARRAGKPIPRSE